MEPSKAPEIFLKPYDPASQEAKMRELWDAGDYANPDTCVEKGFTQPDADTYTIILPPPNVTGTLHLGHAYEDTLQDIIIRFQRMRGKRALWVPGTDSAAIATQARVEKDLQKSEGKSRHDLGREELVRRVMEFAKNSESTIINQVRMMGTSLDWSRYAYTLDDKRNLAVMTAFKRMYDAGLIYRGNRIVNWDPKGQTTISDDEIVYEERDANLVTFKYSRDFPIEIATTRLETKVGDVAVAVHPDDERYKQFVGKEYDALFCDVPIHIRVVADKEVDANFGTGALGVTPAHSMTDWDIADRNDLPRPQVINEYAKMSVEGRLNGKKVLEAREIVLAWLKEEGLVTKEETIKQNVSTAERTGAVIEPLPKLQWWIAVNKEIELRGGKTLKELMQQVVESGAVDMPQEGFKSTYLHWIEHLRDWCISRQIWFGHRIPVWYRGDEIYCDITAPEGDGWTQEEDVLDTWFSSALWTFSTLGWPEQTADLKTYHPTSFMSPAYEILQLWVSRMILMSEFHLGEVPFKKVVLHGLVRDKTGRKFSKSLNNGVDPLDMIEKYGADALRMGLIMGAVIGSDVRFDESRVKGYKLFANKLWNITRFVLENVSVENIEKRPHYLDGRRFSDDDIYENDMRMVTRDVTEHIDRYRSDLAADRLYQFVWKRFADEIIEESKAVLKGSDDIAKRNREWTLYFLLKDSLKLFHPYMPYVTESIWQQLPQKDADALMVAKWPTV